MKKEMTAEEFINDTIPPSAREIEYLLQCENNIPAFDFVFEAYKQLEAAGKRAWLNDLQFFDSHRNYPYKPDHLETVPVGSVEFVHAYFEAHGIKVPNPLNVPEELIELCDPEPYDVPDWEERIIIFSGPQEHSKMQIKNKDIVKHPKNGFSDKIKPVGNWQITEWIEDGFDAEFRVFVFDERIIDVRQYAGDVKYPLDYDYVKECIEKFKSAPPSYTLDIGIHRGSINGVHHCNIHTVIECHHFYSCGTYGFNHSAYLPMLSQWYCWWIREGQKK